MEESARFVKRVAVSRLNGKAQSQLAHFYIRGYLFSKVCWGQFSEYGVLSLADFLCRPLPFLCRGHFLGKAALVQMVHACARTTALLVCVDGLSSYVAAFLRVFRHPVHTGKRGRPRLALASGFLMAQVIKQYTKRRVSSVVHRIVRGTAAAVAAALLCSGGGTVINTASIERRNATFRGALTPLVRRGRAIAHKEATLHAGMWLVGTVYHFCWEHERLRVAAPAAAGRQWQQRTPAMAAGLTDHRWTMRELLSYQIPLLPWVAPKRRGRPPKSAQPQAQATVP